MLTANQVDAYQQNGLLTIPGVLSEDEIEALRLAYERDTEVLGDHRIAEAEGDHRVRAVYGTHLRQPEFNALIRLPRILGVVRQLLGSQAYVYQLKTNAKPAFGGDKWAWHQDLLAWQLVDNLASARLVNVAVLLDEVTEFNGPIFFVPGSHRGDLIRSDRNSAASSDKHLDPNDIALTPADLASCVEHGGMVSSRGTAGSLVFFHPMIVHGSAPNMSPYPRRLAIITYNDVDNPPRPIGEPRPDYLASRDAIPLDLGQDTPITASQLMTGSEKA